MLPSNVHGSPGSSGPTGTQRVSFQEAPPSFAHAAHFSPTGQSWDHTSHFVQRGAWGPVAECRQFAPTSPQWRKEQDSVSSGADSPAEVDEADEADEADEDDVVPASELSTAVAEVVDGSTPPALHAVRVASKSATHAALGFSSLRIVRGLRRPKLPRDGRPHRVLTVYPKDGPMHGGRRRSVALRG